MKRTGFFIIIWSFSVAVFCQSGKLKSTESVNFTSSNLPIFVIDTDNKEIPDEPKITANLGIIYNGPGQRNSLSDVHNHYNGYIGIERRGNSTQHYPKKPYGLETRDALGANLNVSLLGMPEENDWVLRASYFDHTFIRNPLADHMSRLAGRWASRCRLVEVVLNGEYQGIYIFMEKLKRDRNRLDIARLESHEITEPDISGGYIYEITGFEENLGESRNLKYPKFHEAASQQIAYIKQYDDNFRSVMESGNYMDKELGYYAWIDVESFVDEIIVQEAMRNSDAYGWSGYFHKDRNGKINAGPVWDFDQSAGNSSYPDDGIIDGWMLTHERTSNTPFFWSLLWADPYFRYKVRHRWEELRADAFKTENLIAYIDSLAYLLLEAQQREFEKWPVLGDYIWRETEGYEDRDTYDKEVAYLKYFLIQRWAWMDAQLAQVPNPNPNPAAIKTTDLFSDILIYPNPAINYMIFDIGSKKKTVAAIYIYNNLGVLVHKTPSFNLNQGNNSYLLKLDKINQPGVYFYKAIVDNQTGFTGRFIKTE
ncbi:MAG: CotH kinase family protein [Bacteroidales bacterium]|nr:MAG: CotH kinase family protein [Bacteroidales bacterium]